jgi:hypothetical protein
MGTPSLVILDPYRAALTSLALEEGLAQVYPNMAKMPGTTPMETIGRDVRLRQTVLQQLLLFEDSAIIHHEQPGSAAEFAEKRRMPMLSLLNLKQDGIVDFTGDHIAGEIFKGGQRRTAAEIFTLERDKIARWRPLAATQMVLKNYIPHPSFFDVIVAKNDPKGDLEAAMRTVPGWLRDKARQVAQAPYRPVDVALLTACTELDQVDRLAEAAKRDGRGLSIATTSVRDEKFFRTAVDPSPVVEIAIHELIKDNIEFVLPTTLREARNLRSKPEIVAFRSMFLPWLDALRAGNVADEARLRKEVRLSALSWKASGPLKTISRWSFIASLFGELLDFNGMLIEAGRVGLDWMLARSEQRGQWIGLCGRERENPLTEADMAWADARLKSGRAEQEPTKA